MSQKNSKGEIKIKKAKQELQVRPANESRKESEREHLFAALAFQGHRREDSTRRLTINSPYSGFNGNPNLFRFVFPFSISVPFS